ncbi:MULTISPECIES: 4-hydroxybenzoyl-CoA reductase [Bifidobacterium]|uniref:4-hydroxybenzoyl-CoA reductase n=1 Tax=Bifidobacterium TaxID=1678 RepID=UPI001EE80EDC|nr:MULTISPECIES: 4-hydroxybenzoyl-CoA reductase [Bifidobacterium]MDU5132994.1 4-hydroxybenzoyl-CoA reductase [Bifidobacterium sp.]
MNGSSTPLWRSDSAAAVWLMPAGGAAWMVVWIMLGLCAVPLVHVVRYYPFWSIVVSVVTHLLVWLSLGMGRHGWFMGGWLNPRTLGWVQDALCLVYVVILAAAWRKDPGVGWKTPSGSFRP